MKRILVLLPATSGPPTTPPERLSFGRAALSASALGLDVVFGECGESSGEVEGLRAVPNGWHATHTEVSAVFDRFRSQRFPERYAAARAHLGHLPWGNDPAAIVLCRDKWQSQLVLATAGIRMPEVVQTDFEAAIHRWGSAFIKPRYGSFGRHVSRVTPADALPNRGPGMVEDEPRILQRAIAPPEGWAGVSVRALVQRVNKEWICRTPVARRSRHERVVNVARGAEVGPAQALFTTPIATALRDVAIQTAIALDAATPGLLLEVGVDLVVDPQDQVWVIEVNGRPRGRLLALAEHSPSFAEEHLSCCLAPLLELARN